MKKIKRKEMSMAMLDSDGEMSPNNALTPKLENSLIASNKTGTSKFSVSNENEFLSFRPIRVSLSKKEREKKKKPRFIESDLNINNSQIVNFIKIIMIICF